MPDPRPRPLSDVAPLEARELLAAAPWLVEPFQRGPVRGLPQGWSQFNTNPTAGFHVDTAAGLGDEGQLASDGRPGAIGRAWLTAPYAANVETSAAVFLNSPAPARLFVRGRDLSIATPSYYAVEVVRGAEVKLVKVVRGVETVLGRATSGDYLSGGWATVSIQADGDRLRVFLYRGDTNQYLTGDGKWTRQPAAAVEATDRSVRGSGQVGFSRGPAAGAVAVDSLRVGPADDAAPTPVAEERFTRGAAAGLPAGWKQWSQNGPLTVRTAADETLRMDAGSSTPARAWLDRTLRPDTQVSSSIHVDSLIGAGLFARGSRVNTATPSFYAVEVRRGLAVDLVKVIDGRRTVIATLRSDEYLSGQWIQASLVLTGDRLRVQIYRSDTGQYLKGDGTWGLSPAWAMTARDASIRSGGTAGLTRGTGYAGQLTFDNFIVTTSPDRYARPGTIPTEADKPTAPATPGEDLPGPVRPTVPPPPPPPPVPPRVPPPGGTTPGNTDRATVERHYSHIRLANLAYHGTPFGGFERDQLRNSVDLVIPNLTYLDEITRAAPTTPQFVYTNISNIYLGLLTDWNDYADRNGLDREGAFYHVTEASRFQGLSASAVPVDRFWGVYRGSDAGGWDDLTRDASNPGNTFSLAGRGGALALGYIEKFREVTLDARASAGSGWKCELEYVSAADAQGRPTRWTRLPTLGDTTGGFMRDGRVTFDPPTDWQPARVSDGARLYYVRVRTTGSGTPPTATTVLGADYSAGHVIPAFDHAADRDRDGYLNDAEYARRAAGKNARFEYQSRLTYPNYGPMRFATNVADAGFRAWAADYHARFLAATPLADGFFVDNSIGRLAVDPDTIAERIDGYAADYGSLLGAVNHKLAATGKWLIANTAGGNTSAEPVIRNGVSYLEEFALRPLSANHVQFDDLNATLDYRRQISRGKAYEILDSLPTQNIDATAPRMQLATLAMYYTVADPELSFLMMNGGNEPASTWRRHFTPAAEFDVGKPRADQAQFATGADPANRNLTYKVYKREYTNALVLYKPLSYTRGQTGGTGANTATTHQLNGTYRPVRADGTLGAATRTVVLRNGEGAVLARV